MCSGKQNLLDFSLQELQTLLQQMDEPAFRARQIWHWIWQKNTCSFQDMSNVSRALRQSLEQDFSLQLPKVQKCLHSHDGTVKFLFELTDGLLIESVLIPERDHYTLCLSSQAGCSLGCTFCSTGQMGLGRNLSAAEILGQILQARIFLQQRQDPVVLRNIVFMGMGEPLLNWEQVQKSLQIIRDPLALGFSRRRTTVSSVGVPGRLQELTESRLASLALSLHAPNQGLRQMLMPGAARMYPLPELLYDLQKIELQPRERITLEYILIQGVNDSLQQARELNRILSVLPCKLNLIAYNPGHGLPYAAPTQEQVLAFERFLWQKNQTVTLRKSKGRDIQAACGQLKSQHCRTHTKTKNAAPSK
ncbi:MAG: 23S rRNA (adenine(2503)-C(2))-methyltransferase RlmN [Desulfohalobiaceae bacterium]